MAADPAQEVFPWLKSLPLAPEYHPTVAEFQDPIGYIFKIEKEASKYGICKIVPPVPPAPKKTAISNLTRSLAARDPDNLPAFTTRQQQIGFCPRKPCPVKKPVWQSGERYTYQDFEAKAKGFEKGYLKKCGKSKGVSALEMETLFWKASVDKPFSVEYANDMPGSAFAPINGKKKGEVGVGANVGETLWNMRGVSREKGSLLKFMKEEIPGVTSPMLYIAMMFSWFAWHVEDHDLHSLNYLHIGAAKTWYGVPREAAVAFEEVVRVHGYGGEVNPLVTFSVLGEKTTVMSPEVFVTAGVPCCRLVQNAGEFVVTFPRAYHSGFSHGFNCGEAANIATPEWLRVAKDAAIRRASINYPPMVSHFQLLYDLALALSSSIPMSISANPRSSRLKDKKKSEGETLVKELFVQNVLQNNGWLHVLARGSSVVLLPESLSQNSLSYNINAGSQLRENSRLSLDMSSLKRARDFSSGSISNDVTSVRGNGNKQVKSFYNVKGKITSMCGSSRLLHSSWNESACATSHMHNGDRSDSDHCSKDVKGNVAQGDWLAEQRLFSCVTCGILTFDCAAIVQPRISTARYLMSADCSSINDWIVGSGVPSDGTTVAGVAGSMLELNSCTERVERSVADGLYHTPVQRAAHQMEIDDQKDRMRLDSTSRRDSSALGLLALTYGNSSDSEDDQEGPIINDSADEMVLRHPSPENRNKFASSERDCEIGAPKGSNFSLSRDILGNQTQSRAADVETVALGGETLKLPKTVAPGEDGNMPLCERPDEDSSRMHVFCLEHAIEVEQKLRSVGGVSVVLLCHQGYPKIEAEARTLAAEVGILDTWNDISFRDATEKDEEQMQLALDIEEATPGNGDWAVKLGINLFYSANLSRSPLYSKQMPYNSVIYNAFGRNSPDTSCGSSDIHWRRPVRQKKVVAGKWCGKVWMSTQVHPLLVPRDPDEEQEEDRGFNGQATNDEEPERERGNKQKPKTNAVTTKSAKKRKRTSGSGSAKKIKLEENEHESKNVLLHRNAPWQKVYKRRTPKLAVEKHLDSDKSLDESDHKQSRKKSVRYVERVDSGSGESLDETSHHGRPSKGKRSKFIEPEAAFTNDFSSDDSLQQFERIPKTKRKSKDFEINDADSNDSIGDISDEDNVRKRTGKWVWGEEEANSDDSVEDDSFHLHWGNSRDRQAKHVERENSFSNDSLENVHHQRSRITKPRRAECSERGGTDSDDSPVGKYYKSKRKSNYIERRNTFSDDSMEDNSEQQCRIPIKKQAHRVGRLDAGSDYSSEDNPHEQPSATPRRKRTRPGLSQQKNRGLSQCSKQRATKLKKQGISRSIRHGTSVQHKQEIGRNTKPPNNRKSSKRAGTGRKLESLDEEQVEGGPSSRLRRRTSKLTKETEATITQKASRKPKKKGVSMKPYTSDDAKTMDDELDYQCDIEGCTMSFGSKQELVLHKKNICPVKGCGKEFFSHKYLVQHRRVHLDDRPLKCPWKGCKMSFKWAWARTEHIRVHTGARPYVCGEPGCGQTFRFVSDFSRHKRKTGHSAKKGSKRNVSKSS